MTGGTSDRTLGIARSVLKILLVLNIICCALFTLVLAGSFVSEAQIIAMAEEDTSIGDPRSVIQAVRIVMALGLLAVPLAHLVFSRLLAIVETVRAGDPFVGDNARRLTTIAWALLGMQILDLGFGAVSFGMMSSTDRFDWSFGLTGWIAVLMLFVLARVFHHGARMREDLEGTV